MNNNTKKISLLLHNYNHAVFLQRSLEAIQYQTKQPYEVIILDDGSTDNSVEIIAAYVNNNYNFKFYQNPHNMGIVYSMNRLLNLAGGDYVLFTASDDILLPGLVERYSLVLEKISNLGLLHSCGATFSTSDEITNYLKLDAFKISSSPIDKNIHFYSKKDFVNTCKKNYINLCSNTVMCKKDYLINYGGFDPELKWHTDWFAFYMVALRHNSVMLNEYLTLYYLNDDSFHKRGMRDPLKQSQVINNIFSKILQPNNNDLLLCIKNSPFLLTLFETKLLIKCSLKSKQNLKFLPTTIRYAMYKPKQLFILWRNKLYLHLKFSYPKISNVYKFIKNNVRGFNNAKP